MITTTPNTLTTALLEGAPEGLTITGRLVDGPGTVLATVVTVTPELDALGAPLGAYKASFTAPASLPVQLEWLQAGGVVGSEIVSMGAFGVSPGPSYTTPDAVRTELGVNSTVLPDAAALILVADAEDVIDGMLGAWWPDETTGRKIVQARVMAWQWAKLDRATAKMAAAIHRDPQLLRRRDYESIEGPDFKRSGPRGPAGVTSEVLALLDASGLRLLTGRASHAAHGYRRPDYARFLQATRHDGT